MTIIFKAKTSEGYTIKVLFELLQNIVKITCLEVNNDGIKMRMMDSHRNILIDVFLQSTNFNIYDLTNYETIYLGINLGHLYKMLKSIKKNDSLMMTIDDTRPDQLNLIVIPRKNNRISKSSVHIHTIQHINIPLPSGYTNSVIIPSTDYQQTIQCMNDVSKTITVRMKKYSLILSCSDPGDIYSTQVLFGELDDETPEYYDDIFDIERFTRILKISVLNKNMKIFRGSESLPLLLQSQIGQLGSISIFIKSQEQIRIDSFSD